MLSHIEKCRLCALQKSGDNIHLVSVSRPLKGDVYGATLSKWQFFCFSLIAIKARASPLKSHVFRDGGLGLYNELLLT